MTSSKSSSRQRDKVHTLSLSRVGLFITIKVEVFSHLALFNSDPTEVAINKMVEVSQRRITINSQGELGGMSPAIKRHLKLQIKIAQNAARNPDKLERLLKVKQRQKQEAMDIENTPHRFVTERLNCSRWYCIWWRRKAETRK